jgi:DUF917 family protein
MSDLGRPLDRRDLEDLVEGATLLGAGGGGPRWIGLQVLSAIAEEGKAPRLLQPEDLDAEARVAGTASLALGPLDPSAPFPWRLSNEAFLSLEGAYGRKFDAVAPIALGAGNSLLPAIVAATLGRPLVDVAAAPRACPFLAGYSYASLPGPLRAAIVMPGKAPQTLQAPNALALQQILMNEIQAGGGVASLGLFPMAASALRDVAYAYGISKAIGLGRDLRAARETAGDPVRAVCDALGGKVIFRARGAADVANKSGSSALTFVSLDGGARLLVYHLAENLMAWVEGDPAPLAMGPDIITYLSADGVPFTNDPGDLAAVAGKELVVVAAAVPDPERWRAPPVVAGWGAGIAATTGYAGAFVPTGMRGKARAKGTASQRDKLIHLLSEASELEHLICCQYLYAAFSLKQSEAEGLDWQEAMHTRDWAQLLLLVARQEMEHLGLASNLLTSIGGAPHFSRPNFPQTRKYAELPFRLVPFSEEMLQRFICLERPDNAPWSEACGPFDPKLAARARARGGPEFSGEPEESLAALYDHIRRLIANFSGTDAELFIGPPNAEIDGNILHVNFPRPGALGGIWDVTLFDIADRQTAFRAIDLIVSQGEGGPGNEEYTHYRWFRQMLDEYRSALERNPKFGPARPLVSNPALFRHPDAGGEETLITNPAARDALDLFNGAYEALLLLLYRLYGHPDLDANQVTALAYTMFPMMTQIVRPLAEILTSLPAFDYPSPMRAGPSFELTGAISLLPHKDSATRLLAEKLSALSTYAKELGARGDLPARLTSIGANLFIMANKFESIANGTYPPDLLIPGVEHFYTQSASKS